MYERGYIYLLQKAHHIGTKLFKVGRTTRDARERIREYPGCRVKLYTECMDCITMERKIINMFKEYFGKSVEGNETFSGDLRLMKDIINFVIRTESIKSNIYKPREVIDLTNDDLSDDATSLDSFESYVVKPFQPTLKPISAYTSASADSSTFNHINPTFYQNIFTNLIVQLIPNANRSKDVNPIALWLINDIILKYETIRTVSNEMYKLYGTYYKNHSLITQHKWFDYMRSVGITTTFETLIVNGQHYMSCMTLNHENLFEKLYSSMTTNEIIQYIKNKPRA
jgi:hypothetical protein